MFTERWHQEHISLSFKYKQCINAGLYDRCSKTMMMIMVIVV